MNSKLIIIFIASNIFFTFSLQNYNDPYLSNIDIIYQKKVQKEQEDEYDIKKIPMMKNGTFNSDQWLYKPEDATACSPAKTLILPAESNPNSKKSEKNSIIIENYNEQKDMQFEIHIDSKNIEVAQPIIGKGNDISMKFKVEAGEKKEINIEYNCVSKLMSGSDENPWTRVHFTVYLINIDENKDHRYEELFEASLLKICPSSNQQNRFDISILILITSACVIVAFATKQNSIIIDDDESSEFGYAQVAFFLLFGSLFLILLNYFMNYLSVMLTLLVSLMTISSFSIISNEVLIEKYGNDIKNIFLKIPIIGELNNADMIGIATGMLILIPYLLTKHWLLNNIIGTMLTFVMIKVVRIPNFKIGAFLLMAFFIYDIFWVFYSEKVFGNNVMKYVATSIDLPLKLVFPVFKDQPIPSCSLIGLGDLALPGFFIFFTHKIDLQQKNTNLIYYKTAMFGYLLGSLICCSFLFFFQVAQPALLYLSPCVLIPVYIQAHLRNELHILNKGLLIQISKKNVSSGYASVKSNEQLYGFSMDEEDREAKQKLQGYSDDQI